MFACMCVCFLSSSGRPLRIVAFDWADDIESNSTAEIKGYIDTAGVQSSEDHDKLLFYGQDHDSLPPKSYGEPGAVKMLGAKSTKDRSASIGCSNSNPDITPMALSRITATSTSVRTPGRARAQSSPSTLMLDTVGPSFLTQPVVPRAHGFDRCERAVSMSEELMYSRYPELILSATGSGLNRVHHQSKVHSSLKARTDLPPLGQTATSRRGIERKYSKGSSTPQRQSMRVSRHDEVTTSRYRRTASASPALRRTGRRRRSDGDEDASMMENFAAEAQVLAHRSLSPAVRGVAMTFADLTRMAADERNSSRGVEERLRWCRSIRMTLQGADRVAKKVCGTCRNWFRDQRAP